jgi:flagellar basal-body rod modification protein FlgD
VQTNARLDTLLTTSALQQAEAVIGHTITTPDGLISGRVASVQISSGGGAIATLEDGRMVRLQAGVTLS